VSPPTTDSHPTTDSSEQTPTEPEIAAPPVLPDTSTPDSGAQASPEPELTQAPIQEVLTPELPQEITEVAVPENVSDQPNSVGSSVTSVFPREVDLAPEELAVDEILQQPSDLRQAAQSVVVPAQNKQQPFSSNTLFAGLIGLGLFALIAGLIVARRGVPGAIAS
jgi:hypothetical protein